MLDAPASLPPVAADAGQLRQVLSNLIDNAIKYSPDGGTVTLALAARDHHIQFAVTDVGLGIPPAEHGRIFEKFYRLDPDMTRGIGGTGLGLYICRELVRRVNGRHLGRIGERGRARPSSSSSRRSRPQRPAETAPGGAGLPPARPESASKISGSARGKPPFPDAWPGRHI